MGIGATLCGRSTFAQSTNQDSVRLQAPVVGAVGTVETPSDDAWQSRSTTSVRPARPAVNVARLPNAGPAIRVTSGSTNGTTVRWKVRDNQSPGTVVVNRDSQVRAVTELQLNDPQSSPFDETRLMRTAVQEGGAFGDAAPPTEVPPADETLPPKPAPSLDEPALEAPGGEGVPPTELAPPSQLEQLPRTIPMGPPTNLPPKSLPAAPPRKLEANEDVSPESEEPALPPKPLPKSTTPGRSVGPTADSPMGGGTQPADEGAACRRLYNERNCCSDENACNAHRAFVKAHPLSKISLDITPICNLTSRTEGDQGGQCGFPFEQSPSRTWRDRLGKELASGRVTAIANLRVEITDDDGNAVRIRVRDLGEDDICFLAAWCGVPSECRLDDVALAARNWTPTTMTWKASGLCHKPLYFEQVQLERYGHTAGPFVQPVISGAHFFANIALLPYNMGINPPNECQYALGYYRPGSCAPWMIPPFPLSVRGALAETGVVLGGVFLIP